MKIAIGEKRERKGSSCKEKIAKHANLTNFYPAISY